MDPCAVAGVAVHHRFDPVLRLAWSGDARAYRLSHTAGLHPLIRSDLGDGQVEAAGAVWGSSGVPPKLPVATLTDGHL
ncbi:hypothetical protein ACNPQM_21830 [Streptomyces sp. NPDC056231]|uniref:hypothetical protein n=1 Tax=Streptomyces sp. NPDC056231 TaxID=3345755 RepID=UPI003AAB15C7